MGRNQFTFYASFASALARIRKKSDRADAYDAICRYALFGELPDLEALSDSAAIAFDLIRPTLDASRRKAESGRAGGLRRPSGSAGEGEENRSRSAGEAKEKQPGREGERENKSENKSEKEKENDCSPPVLSRPAPEKRRQGPTLDQVEDYARRRRAQADPRAFYDYYAAAGWRDAQGKPVYNWQQKFIAWDLRERSRGGRGGGAAAASLSAAAAPRKPGENTARMKEYLRQQQQEKKEGEET